MDWLEDILHGDGNSDDLRIVAVDTCIGDGVTAVSTCPHCGQVHDVYLPESTVEDYNIDGFQTVLTLVPSICGVCAYEARQAAERAERSAALSAWRANHSPILDGLTYAHGLSAYRGSRSVREIFRSVDDIQSHPEWELCCTDTIYNDKSLVGEYGLYVKGTLTGLYDGDCWSEIDSQGNRYATRSNPIDLDDLFDIRADGENYSHREYCEAWVKDVRIVGVWITDSAARRWSDVRDAMQSIADGLGVDLSIVQVHDSYDCRYDDLARSLGYDY